MEVYITNVKKISGTRWADVSKDAMRFYGEIKRKTKRRPYVRSAYFKKEKIFLELFWHHLHEKKNISDRARRVAFFPSAIDCVARSRCAPVSKRNPNKKGEMLHRFFAKTKEGELFCIQVKEKEKTSTKWLISVFPYQ